jgi:basic membrane lipoprotein Med (substrate-binding protein (PBP1-ABC) superfamily)
MAELTRAFSEFATASALPSATSRRKRPAEFEEQFRQYGSQGYDLVFGHGFEFQDAAKRVGPDHPRSIFVVTVGLERRGECRWNRVRIR